jgi:diguanylate cyclase (GGDEF)-like protein
LEEAIAIHEKQHETFSIMFIDVDHFKSVNDNYGHVIGSKLLQDIGEVLSLILRASDHIYRYGGDEFVVIMPTVAIATVHEIAKRVLYKIKNKEFDIGNGEKYKLSVSVGLAEYPTDAKSALEIIKFADEMMYMSKRSGRGKVFHVNEVEDVDASSE